MNLQAQKLIRQLIPLVRLLATAMVCWFVLPAANLYAADSVDQSRKQDCQENERGRRYEKLPAPSRLTTDTSIVHTRIGGRDFYVPRNYFRHPQIGCGVEEKGMLLRVLLPDLKPYSKTTAAEYAAQLGIGKKMNILLTSRASTRPLIELTEIYLNGSTAEPPTQKTYGLFHGRHMHGDDFYYFRRGDQVTRLIRCRPVRPNKGSICGHRFKFNSHDVKLTYGRMYLSNLRLLQSSVEQLLFSFATPPQN